MSEIPRRIFSIGHSNQDLDHFVSLLRAHDVDAVADVRSSPWSRYAPQFNRESLERSLGSCGIDYLYLGYELGGRPDGEEFYDDEGRVLYSEVASTNLFGRGLRRLEVEASKKRIAMMCSEEDPTDCHRRLLVARVLIEQGVRVDHIRGDGRTQSEGELAAADPQPTLFAEEAPWRSTRSVSPRRPRATSSAA